MLQGKEGTIDVLTAAKKRIINIFSNGVKVYMAFSCGKDSITMSSLTYDLIMSGQIDKNLLNVFFIDEEGLHPEMEKAAYLWREKWNAIGVPFLWFCLPFKQVCDVDQLAATESWITWEPGKEDVWIRKPPSFAIFDSPYLHYPGEMNYQTWCEIALKDGLNMIGLRVSESLTRQRIMAKTLMNAKNGQLTKGNHVFPIYDWKDTDIWLYLKQKNLYFPETYIQLYEQGVSKSNMRLSNFFGGMAINGLLHIMEVNPELWDRIEKRIPNAYLAVMYWNSEMFGRSTRLRRELEGNPEDNKDYRAILQDMLFVHPENYNIPTGTGVGSRVFRQWKHLFIKSDGNVDNKLYKEMYEKILAGDPKARSVRMMYTKIYTSMGKKYKLATKAKEKA